MRNARGWEWIPGGGYRPVAQRSYPGCRPNEGEVLDEVPPFALLPTEQEPLTGPELDDRRLLNDPEHFRYTTMEVRCDGCDGVVRHTPHATFACCRTGRATRSFWDRVRGRD